MDNEQERNEHFKGFAKLLIPELDEQVGAVVEWGLEHDASEKEIAQELASRWNTLIAQRAYDLAAHVIDHLDSYTYDTATKEQDYWNVIPDLIEWPTP